MKVKTMAWSQADWQALEDRHPKAVLFAKQLLVFVAFLLPHLLA
jgi:hypothetical protein